SRISTPTGASSVATVVSSWSDPAIACAPFGWLSWLASYLSVQRDARAAQGPVRVPSAWRGRRGAGQRESGVCVVPPGGRGGGVPAIAGLLSGTAGLAGTVPQRGTKACGVRIRPARMLAVDGEAGTHRDTAQAGWTESPAFCGRGGQPGDR